MLCKTDTFVEGKNTDKIVNTYDKRPYIRITWLNEPKDKKFDATFFKSWADDECNSEKLYAEGSHDFKHYSLTFLTANNLSNLNVDTGVTRRIRACPHKSKFVDNEKDKDEKNHTYLKDKDFMENFENDIGMKLAFFQMMAEVGHEWLKTKKIDVPEQFTELEESIKSTNDHIQDSPYSPIGFSNGR
jgi:hypothetical protein